MAVVALHRARFDLGGDIWVDIESVLGKGRPMAVAWNAPGLTAAEEESSPDAVASGGMLPMCWREAGHLFESFQLREDTDYFVDVRLPISIADAEAQSACGQAWPFLPRLANIFKRDPKRRWTETLVDGRPATLITGQLRLRSHAGVLSLGTELGGSLFAEVACRKLKYFDEFKTLLDSLAEKAAELLLAFDSPVSLSFDTSADLAKNDAALHFLMRHIMARGNLPTAIEEILARPHVRLVERLEAVPIEEIEDAQADLIADGVDVDHLIRGGPLARLFRGYTPTALPQRESFESMDTPENRYAKAFLEHCSLIAHRLAERMAARSRRASQREAQSWASELDEALQQGMWRDVGPLGQIPANSQALQRKRGYKELFRFDLSLRMSLALAWKQGQELADGLVGDVRPVNQIYEYWCFFVLREILLSIGAEVGGGNFITVSQDGLRVELARGRRSECRFEFVATSGQRVLVSLFYNKRFRRSKVPSLDWSGSYTASFDPDFSVVARSDATRSTGHWLHFDAKYRLERQEAEELFDDDPSAEPAEATASASYETELARIHKQDDLFKMHAYRDGILSTRGAYVLFPGDGVGGKTTVPRPNFFVRHPSALGGSSARRIPSVGAFDLAPGGDPLQAAAIRGLLLAVLEVAASGDAYREEQGSFASP